MEKMADRYHSKNRTQPVPDGVVSQVTVIVFADSSVYVGGPSVVQDGLVDGDSLVAALKIGLELMGGGGEDVELHSEHDQNDLMALTSGPAEA